MQNKTSNGLAVGDHVVSFRGDETGVVESIETDRGGGRSDKVIVNGRSFYCSVWSKVTR